LISDSPLVSLLLMASVLSLVILIFRRARGQKTTGERTVRRGPGPGAMGAVYGMLNEDKQNAIEIVVEQKAAAVDPERARDKDPKPRSVRLATLSDVGEIVRVTNLAYRVEDFFIDGDRTNGEEVAAKMSAPGGCFLVIDVPSGNGLAASVYVELRGDRAYFGMLSVAPAHQKKGLSRALIDGIEAYARKHGCRALEIDVVNVREELPAFYDLMGFKVTGAAPFTKGHTLKRPVHMILMEKRI
jgi:GNAT superfamily N-acetyltransferase